MVLLGTQLGGPVHPFLSIAGAAWVGWFINQRGIFMYFLMCALALVLALGAQYAMRGLATLATGGVYGPDNSGTGGYFYASNYLLFGILWLILGIPHRAFKYEFDRDGERSAQGVMVGTLATISMLLAAAYIILLHYGGGPFSKVDLRPLIVGDFAAAFIIFPIFRTIARRCWQRGLFGSLSPGGLIMHWGSAALELDAATSAYWEKYYKLKDAENSLNRSGADSRANSPSPDSNAKTASPLGKDTQSTGPTASASDTSRNSPGQRPRSGRTSVPRKSVQQRRKRAHKRR